MKYLKNWVLDLILGIIFLTCGILLLIPSIYPHIVSIFVGAFLLIFYILKIVPKYKKIKSMSAEWVTWLIIESVLIITLSVLSIVNQQTSIDLGFITLQLSHIVGLVFIIEGIIGLVKLCNLIYVQELKYRPKKFTKYFYIILVIIGTFIFASINISTQDIAIMTAVICFIVFIVTFSFMIDILVKKSKNKPRKAVSKEKK